MLLVSVLEVQAVHQDRQSQSGRDFSKVLAQADTFAAKERCERERVTQFAVRPQVVGRLFVKPFGDEGFRFLPLLGIFLDCLKGDQESFAFLDRELWQLGV